MTKPKRTPEQIAYDIHTESKRCFGCGVRKPFSEYYRLKRMPDGHMTRCKTCSNKTRNEAFKEKPVDPDTRRKHLLKYKYGVAYEWYEGTLLEQQGGCAICGTTQPAKGRKHLCVDHDHETGAVRGILCSDCNIGLSHFKDDPERMRAAAKYIEERKCTNN